MRIGILIGVSTTGSTVPSGGPSTGVLTEGGDFLVTEAGDYLIQE